MEEKYIKALQSAIINDFPQDIIIHIHNQLKNNSATFHINSFLKDFHLSTDFYISDERCIKQLLQLGYDVNYQNPENGSTMLMYVAQNGSTAVAKFLLEYGANIHIKNNNGYDCFKYANDRGGSMKAIFDTFLRNYEKTELIKKNELLEKQYLAMNEKMDALFQMLGQMNISADDLIHKKTKMETD